MTIKTPPRFTLSGDFRMSLGWAIVLVLLIGVVFIATSNPAVALPQRMKVLNLAVFFYGVALVAWLFSNYFPLISRWFIVVGFVAVVCLGVFWVGETTFLSLLVLPVGLAMALLGFPAAAIVTLAESVLLVTLPGYASPELTQFTIVLTLMTLWFMLGLIFAIYRPIRQLTQWSFEHYWRAQKLLDESRDRKAELQHVQDELVRSNYKLSLLNDKLHQLTLVADEARQAKEIFVAKVSHEFRTPLNMIIALADLLLETPEIYGDELPAPLLEDLHIVQRNSKHLADLIDDVLDLSQAEAGHLSLQRGWVDLREDIGTAVAVIQPLVQKKHLSLTVICPDNLPTVYCDRTRIRQVVLNLVSNAARFTSQGGIILAVTRQDNDVLIQVTDTGPGVAERDLPKVFEPFFQTTGGNWQDLSGNGLGLSISKQFVELHGGRMWLESEVGVGSTFSFSLPISPVNPQPPRAELTLEEWRWREPDLQVRLPRLPFKERVVVCDETGGLRAQLRHAPDGLEVVHAKDLAETLGEVEQCPAHAIIVNSLRPDEFLQQLGGVAKDTPIFACSFPPVSRHVANMGVANYLTKPVTLEKLSEAIEASSKAAQSILVVDDNLDVQQVLTRTLGLYKKGLQVMTASNGKAALELLHQNVFDLILLDLTLPDMSGWDVIEYKNKSQRIKSIPVIIVSAQDPVEPSTKSNLLLATVASGFSGETVLRCSLELSKLLGRTV
jgi:signal transduction histidine kinase/CheY-like chemotaxis protein